MKKLTGLYIANVLMEKDGLEKSDATQFVANFFDTIKKGLELDNQVKVKGLGTFKVIDVEPRESINVNTGERVVIESHQKVTFTPDPAMKELVNKPFSSFDTVILNEGVSFDDMAQSLLETELSEGDAPAAETAEKTVEAIEEPAEEAVAVIEEAIEEPAEEAVADIEEAEVPIEEPATAAEEETAQAEEKVTQAEEETTQTEEETTQAEEETELPAEETELPTEVADEDTTEERAEPRRWPWILLAIAACVLSFAAGYYAGHRTAGPEETAASEQQPATEVAEQATAAPAADPADTVSATAAKEQTATAKAQEKAQPQSEDDKWEKYERMDERVRTGAYRIVGTAEVQKVREGDNTNRIAKRTLGPDMACYIEVYNGITAKTPLTVGSDIKIPKLALKKKKKQQQQ